LTADREAVLAAVAPRPHVGDLIEMVAGTAHGALTLRRPSGTVTPVPARRAPEHAKDAGGDPDVLAAKASLREEVWDALQSAGAARFPGAFGRIPNFIGAERAAELLRGTAQWRRAATLKANPDSPQWPVRQRALEDGKTVFMAVPRLADDNPFFLLDPDRLSTTPRTASSISGASEHGVKVAVEELEPVDLVVAGSVAVDTEGRRLGKGGGFSDLEYAIAAQLGLINGGTTVVTTVHEAQVVATGRIPVTGHDIGIDLIVTPERVITCTRDRRRRVSIRWAELTDEKVAAIPVLQRLRAR
jgi:5-formyltetrahydrofolate cyclo-ligase